MKSPTELLKKEKEAEMKITLEIPDEMRCLAISGVMAKDGNLLLVSTTIGSDTMYDGAEFRAQWEEKPDET